MKNYIFHSTKFFNVRFKHGKILWKFIISQRILKILLCSFKLGGPNWGLHLETTKDYIQIFEILVTDDFDWLKCQVRDSASFEFTIWTMNYRKHGVWVLIERCFKQTAMKYVDYSIKLSPYRQFCYPLSLISTLSSASIHVSPRFFGEFDMLTFTARHLEKPFIPVLRSQLENLLKPP